MTLAQDLFDALRATSHSEMLVGDMIEHDPNSGTPAAVLIAITDRAEPGVILTLRREHMRTHAGQVAFPGGRLDPGEDAVAAALREAHEEIGVDPAQISILGQLSTLYIRPSNNLVLPVVGWSAERPTFIPDPREVALLVEASLLEFLDPANRRTEVWELQNRTANVPLFGIQNQVIWGATAMILGELLALPALRRVPGLVQA